MNRKQSIFSFSLSASAAILAFSSPLQFFLPFETNIFSKSHAFADPIVQNLEEESKLDRQKRWKESWDAANRRPGFHNFQYNRQLVKYLPLVLNLANSKSSFKSLNARSVSDRGEKILLKNPKVFVPLCGKTKDLVYLANYGFEAVGVEFVQAAIDQFAEDEDITWTKTPALQDDVKSEFDVFEASLQTLRYSSKLSIWKGDFFKFKNAFQDINSQSESVNNNDEMNSKKVFHLGYDRASLVAIQPVLRDQYAKDMSDLCERQLLLTCEYDQSLMDGPPFSVSEKEVRRLYESKYDVVLIERKKVEYIPPRWSEKGLKEMFDLTFVLLPKGEKLVCDVPIPATSNSKL